MPRFTILLPYRDGATDLAMTLETLLTQSRGDWEALLIDAGAQDDSARVAAQYAELDPRIRLLPLPVSQQGRFALSSARNFGLAQARGQILAFCEAGALWLPEKLQRLEEALEDVTVDACFAPASQMVTGLPLGGLGTPGHDLTVKQLMSDHPGYRLANFALRSEVAATLGSFDTRLAQGDDLVWLIRLVGSGHRVAELDAPLSLYPRAEIRGAAAEGHDLAALCSGRLAALVAAAHYEHALPARERALLLHRQARRALRLGAPRRQALRLALRGLRTSPSGWFSDRRRGALTLAATLAYQLMPQTLRRNFFAN